jgi:lipoprotein-anchoring transpeptidase ErfK/SrfK
MSDIPQTRRGIDRRTLLGGAAAAGGVALTGGFSTPAKAQADPLRMGSPASMYAAVVDGGHSLPAIPIDKIDRRFLRQVVIDPTFEKPGTIVIDTSTHFLYLVLPDRKALRYGVSLGKAGFEWTGSALIQYKKAWPVWTPPPEMIKRKPELAKYATGMPPGPQSPLGARAMYLFKNGKDTMYRIHGTPEWASIGKNASSGCLRMINQDVIDLYARVSGQVTVHVRHSMYLGANSSSIGGGSGPTTEAIDSGVPEGAEKLE